jgi:hypothetical protein
MGSEMVFGLPDQLSAVSGDDERAGGSSTKPTAKRREEARQECRQHEAKSAAAAVSRIRGTRYRCFLARGGCGRSPLVASSRAKGIDTFCKEHNRSDNT